MKVSKRVKNRHDISRWEKDAGELRGEILLSILSSYRVYTSLLHPLLARSMSVKKKKEKEETRIPISSKSRTDGIFSKKIISKNYIIKN